MARRILQRQHARVRPAMQQLAECIRGSVAVGHRDRLSSITSSTALRMDVGLWAPLASTAIGNVFLATGCVQTESAAIVAVHHDLPVVQCATRDV